MDQSLGWIDFSDGIQRPDPGCPNSALAFVYRAGLKVRFIGEDGKKVIRWLKSEGLNHKSLWRGELITPTTEVVWLTEGEPDALRLMNMGFGELQDDVEVVCALPDAGYKIRTDELALLRWKEIIFAPDNDEAGTAAVQRLTRTFSQAGIKFSTIQL
jgi:hypothetical protein